MVRLLKVKELEDRKRFLLAQSELYRQTLTLEIANVNFSAALLKRRLKSKCNLALVLGSALPLAGFLFARERATPVGGVLPKVLAGWKLFNKFMPWVKTFHAVSNRIGQRQNLTHYR